MIGNPCRYCTTETGRSTECHSNCEKYIKYKEELDKEKENVRKQKERMYAASTRTKEIWVGMRKKH